MYSLSMNESTACVLRCGGTLPGAFPISQIYALMQIFEPKAIKGSFASPADETGALSRVDVRYCLANIDIILHVSNVESYVYRISIFV